MAKKRMKKQKRETRRKSQGKKGMWNYLKSESNIKKLNWKVFIICILIVAAVAYIGSLFTVIGTWYSSVKPSFTPPNIVFPIVWTFLFYLIAVSLYYSWTETEQRKKKKVIVYYGINFILNILWSVIFFTLESPRLALLEILILWVSILFLIAFNWNKSRKAAYFLIPYLLWVSFAVVLNYFAIR